MKNFSELGLAPEIVRAVDQLGFGEPTPVQAKIIPLMLHNTTDMVGLAQTGTGKTAAFGLPLVQLINISERRLQALVFCPTRELCMQVAGDLKAFSRNIPGLSVLAVYGGSPIDAQMRALKKGVHITVATPGRLNDLINRKKVVLSGVDYVIFDEADEMLNMGFKEELNAILAHTPPDRKTLLFSATMSREVADIASNYMHDPLEITVGARNSGAENVEHIYYVVAPHNRYPALRRIVDSSPGCYAICFCRTRRDAADVAARLSGHGYAAEALHGDLTQSQRDSVMRKFRSGALQILIATDVAARGLDVNDLTHVINYNLPDDISAYTHRSGRTGRAGRNGVSIVLVTPAEAHRIRLIEKRIKRKFRRADVPSGQEICRSQMLEMAHQIENFEFKSGSDSALLDEIREKLSGLDKDDLLERLLHMQFGKLFDSYRNAPDLNAHQAPRRQKRGKYEKQHRPQSYRRGNSSRNTGERNSGGLTRLRIGAGRRQGVVPQGIIGTINTISGTGRIKIGKIDIQRNSTVMEADSRYTSRIVEAFRSGGINGRTASVEVLPVSRGRNNRPKSARSSRYNAA